MYRAGVISESVVDYLLVVSQIVIYVSTLQLYTIASLLFLQPDHLTCIQSFETSFEVKATTYSILHRLSKSRSGVCTKLDMSSDVIQHHKNVNA